VHLGIFFLSTVAIISIGDVDISLQATGRPPEDGTADHNRPPSRDIPQAKTNLCTNQAAQSCPPQEGHWSITPPSKGPVSVPIKPVKLSFVPRQARQSIPELAEGDWSIAGRSPKPDETSVLLPEGWIVCWASA